MDGTHPAISAKLNIADIERHCNNFFNPRNNPKGKRNHPPEFLALAERILHFRNGEHGCIGNVASYSEGKVSISFATTGDGVAADWTQVFKRELAAYKRARFI